MVWLNPTNNSIKCIYHFCHSTDMEADSKKLRNLQLSGFAIGVLDDPWWKSWLPMAGQRETRSFTTLPAIPIHTNQAAKAPGPSAGPYFQDTYLNNIPQTWCNICRSRSQSSLPQALMNPCSSALVLGRLRLGEHPSGVGMCPMSAVNTMIQQEFPMTRPSWALVWLQPAQFVWGKVSYSLENNSLENNFQQIEIRAWQRRLVAAYSDRPFPALPGTFKSYTEGGHREEDTFGVDLGRELTLDPPTGSATEQLKTSSHSCSCPIHPQIFIEHLLCTQAGFRSFLGPVWLSYGGVFPSEQWVNLCEHELHDSFTSLNLHYRALTWAVLSPMFWREHRRKVKLLTKVHTVMVICHQRSIPFLLTVLLLQTLKGLKIASSLSESCSEQILPWHQLMMMGFGTQWQSRPSVRGTGLPTAQVRYGCPTSVSEAELWNLWSRF